MVNYEISAGFFFGHFVVVGVFGNFGDYGIILAILVISKLFLLSKKIILLTRITKILKKPINTPKLLK